jgi:hypothetical protein
MTSFTQSFWVSRRRARRAGGAMLALALMLAGGHFEARAGGKQLRDWVRRWLGNGPIAGGGTRGDGAVAQPGTLCLLHPWIQPQTSPPLAVVSVPRPALVIATPIRRISLEYGSGGFLGDAEIPAKSATPGGLIPWPGQWPSLVPGQRYRLFLQLAQTDDTPALILQAGSEVDFRQTRDLIQSLGSNPGDWERAIEAQLAGAAPPSAASRARAASLLFAPEAPASLQGLRQSLRHNPCGGGTP